VDPNERSPRGDRAVEHGLATRTDLERLADGGRRRAASEGGWFCIPHGEILCQVPHSGNQTSATPHRRRHLDAGDTGHNVVMARTTVTLDADVALLIKDAARRGRTSMKQVVNDALRRALSQPTSRREPYRLEVRPATLQPGFDLVGANSLADQLEDDAILAVGRRALR
jgi:Arc/MetJ family transcription regulator